MSNGWVAVVAALGASFLTGLSTFGLTWWQARRKDKIDLINRRSRAYSSLLVQSMSVAHLALNMHIAIEFRSGLREGLNTTIGRQRGIDALEIADRLGTEMKPLYEAWSEIWMIGSKEAIAEANDLIARCSTVVGAATQPGKGAPTWLKAVIGEKWTQGQLDQWQEEQRLLAESRRRFGNIARKELGVKVVDLFASNELQQAIAPDPQVKVQSHGGRP